MCPDHSPAIVDDAHAANHDLAGAVERIEAKDLEWLSGQWKAERVEVSWALM